MKRTPIQRRTEMKRGPWNRTPGPAAGTYRQGGELRRGRIKAQSAKRRKVNAARRKLAADHLDEPCRLRTPVCTGWAEHWHELVASAHSGSRTDLRNLAPSCDACNSHVEVMPDRFELGLKVHSSQAVRTPSGLVPRVASPYAAISERGGAA